MSMQECVIYTCDKCGTKAYFEKGVSPKKWDRIRGYDLCPDCKKKYDDLFANFLFTKEMSKFIMP